MKKLVKMGLGLCLGLSFLCGCSSSGSDDKPVLKVYNTGEYIDMSVLDDFEKEFNCKVIYETFDSNETMYTKLMGGNQYDVIVPSEYMIERLMKEDLIQTIDWSKITNKDNLDTSIMNQAFDPNNEYWVPYFYGNVGIVYDTTVVDQADLQAGWEILRNEKYKGNIYMYDSERDSFMVALKALGYSMNSEDPQEIEAAYQWLVEQRSKVAPVYVDDAVIDNMISGEKALAVVYSGDAATVMNENEDLAYFMPEEGTNLWFDGFVITKDCKEVDLAHEFINFMIQDDISLRNALAVGYRTSNVAAAKEASESEFKGNSAYDIRQGENDEIFGYQPIEVKTLYEDYWTRVKSN